MYIAKEIKCYHATKKEIISIENDIIYSSHYRRDVNDMHKDEVASKVTVLVQHKTLNQMKEFVEIFEDVYNRLNFEKQKMIELLYWSNKHYNCVGVGREIGVEASTIGRWRIAVLNEIATRMGMK